MVADLDSVRHAYTAALLARDTTRARAVVEGAHDELGDLARVGLDVLAPAMRDIGDLWERGEATVADEHYASGVTEGLLAVLSSRMRKPPAGGRLAVVTCVSGERHAIGVRLLADLLEAEAWEVLQLGPDMPVRALLDLVAAEQPDVVAVSATMPDRCDAAMELLAALSIVEPRPFLAAGGQAFGAAGATAVGADLVADDMRALIAEVKRRFPPLPE